MNKNDLPAFQNCVRALFASFGQECTEAAMTGYWMGLSDLELSQVQFAIASALRTSTFTPRPAELRKLTGCAVDSETRATQAWLGVLRAVRLGPYKHIDFSDKLCNAAIRALGGWPNFVARFIDTNEEEFARHAFSKAYRNLSASSLSDEACRPLAGISEACVIDHCLSSPVPIRIFCEYDRNATPLKMESRMPKEVNAIVEGAFT